MTTSEDREIDEFIQQIQLNAKKHQEVIEWIPFDKLENVKYLAKGSFGIVYKWLFESFDNPINKNDFLQEIKNQLRFRGKNSIAIYGITKNQTENECMMVMNYAKYGNLRKVLNDKFKKFTWKKIYNILFEIVIELTNIHEMGLMHKDFSSCYITDFGLCKPVTENDPENIYGVIPYMVPKTLSKGEYTQASDIYSFGMVMLEVLTSYPPYYYILHNENLAIGICEGLNPEIKCEIMKKCWSFEPLNCPTAKELKSQLESYYYNDNIEIRNQVNKQVNAANKSNKNFIKYNKNKIHPEAIYTSRHLPFLKTKKVKVTTYVIISDTKQWDFEIPDDIIEENEIQEN
ncbi:hypothetical protein Glove_715g9 [Diversispora epigaea]|uniref:Protein kinase domain-containing protein n=1 Tax=Diversispora epigaea TaxID=1348612 RepID=A0A397G3I4_9GLOM|nr:hypothetical protein Glove_715g9 [Diversispora epigaea]